MTRRMAMLLAFAFIGFCTQTIRSEEPPADGPPQPPSLTHRVIFVPDKAHPGGGSCMRLSPGPGPAKPGSLFMMAHAGVGDDFPVQSPEGKTIFEIAMTDGADDRVVLEVRVSKDDKQKIELDRDKTITLTVGSHQYELYYPSVSVNLTDKNTSSQVMLIVTQMP